MKWKFIILALVVCIPISAFPQTSNKVAHLVTKEESLGKLLPGADIYSLTTDANFKRAAYVVKRGAKEVAVVDGVEGKEYDKAAEKGEMYFSPDGRRLAYIANRGQKRLVVVDGVEGRPYDFIYDLFNPVFSPDSKHLAYIVDSGLFSKRCAVLDGMEQKKYDLVERLIFSPDSKKLAYHAERQWNRVSCLVVNGVEGASYSETAQAIFSPDSSRLAFVAFRRPPTRTLAVIDGKDGPEFESAGRGIHAIIFSPDSQHTAYAMGGTVYRDGVRCKLSGAMPEYEDPVFSPDSQRLAYVANRGMWKIVVNDQIFDDQQVRRYTKNLTFSPDSKHLAYITRFDSPTNTGYDYLVLDGVVQKDSKGIVYTPRFSLDGKRLAYLLRTEDRKEMPVYGEFRGGEYDRFVTCDVALGTQGPTARTSTTPFTLDQDGTLRAIVLRASEIFRLELKVAEN